MIDEFEKNIDEALDEASMNSIKTNTDGLPESPASANIKVWIKGFGVMFTVRDNIMNNVVGKIEKLIQTAEEKKWQPTWEVKVLPKTIPMESAKNCSIHGTPMTWRAGVSKKTGKPYAFWACDQKLADGNYCNGQPMEVKV